MSTTQRLWDMCTTTYYQTTKATNDHFFPIFFDTLLVCSFCGLIIRRGGINRFKKHLAGRKGEVAPCMVVDQDVRVAIEATLKETDDKRIEKFRSNVVVSDDEEQEGNKGSKIYQIKMVEKTITKKKRVPKYRDIRSYACEYCGIVWSKKTLIKLHIQSNHQVP